MKWLKATDLLGLKFSSKYLLFITLNIYMVGIFRVLRILHVDIRIITINYEGSNFSPK